MQKYFERWGYGYYQYTENGEDWYWIPGKGTMPESALNGPKSN